jgi:apolipoprotein D and lipocalin family protein
VALLLLGGCERPPVNRDTTQALTTAKSVDVKRYLGKWYEIARFPNEFEKDCVDVTADYGLSGDKTLSVVNRCRKQASQNSQEESIGSARIVDDETNAKLAVTFFWPFEGDYWILAVADDYSWSLVGEPSGRYLWILARSPHISPELTAELTAKLKKQGYKTDALYWTPQSQESAATR